jgi:hypothetical protein
VVAANQSGGVLSSTNSGATWNSGLFEDSSHVEVAVACSSGGSAMIVADPGWKIYVSTNSGMNWAGTVIYPFSVVRGIACSGDGTRIVVANDGETFISTNSGLAWQTVLFAFPSAPGLAVASTADGSKWVAAALPGLIYTWQPPTLTITESGTMSVISWLDLSTTTNFVLQANSDLTTTNWMNVALTPSVITNSQHNLENQVTVPVTGAQQFFRLESP